MLKKNKVFAIITVLALMSMLLVGLVPLAAHADPTIPALTKQAVFTIGSQTVQVDGQSYQMDVAPYIDSANRTQVPVRFLGDVLGMTAQWDQAKQQVTLIEQHFTAMEGLVIGSNTLVWVNGTVDSQTTMDTTPVIVSPGRTMLPARWVAQAIGYNVTWNAANQTVTVSPQGQPSGGGGSGGSVIPGGGVGTGTGGSTGTTPVPGAHNF